MEGLNAHSMNCRVWKSETASLLSSGDEFYCMLCGERVCDSESTNTSWSVADALDFTLCHFTKIQHIFYFEIFSQWQVVVIPLSLKRHQPISLNIHYLRFQSIIHWRSQIHRNYNRFKINEIVNRWWSRNLEIWLCSERDDHSKNRKITHFNGSKKRWCGLWNDRKLIFWSDLIEIGKYEDSTDVMIRSVLIQSVSM